MKSPALMGIVNVTPDSFSDGGRLGQDAVMHAKKMAEAGADILDFGAESTRPGAVPLTAEEEWARLEPVLAAVCNAPWREHIRLSVDTRHSETASRALELGVEIINDVSGLDDAAMLEVLSPYACDIVVMHALGIPADAAKTLSADTDPVQEVLAWKRRMVARIETAGIAPERLIFDPGIGFGKTAEQSLALVLAAPELVKSGGRWLFGHSRKSFLTMFGALPAHERDGLTLAFSAQLAAANVAYVRVHDVAGHRALFERL